MITTNNNHGLHLRQKVQRAFSRSAARYDRLSALHRRIGQELLDDLPSDQKYTAILDVGMGTGWMTHQLATRYPAATVVGLDFAEGMLAMARRQYDDLKMVQADAGVLPFRDNHFDLVISNLAYQWVEDLPQAFRRCEQILKNQGVLSFTLFGHQTFKELFEAMDVVSQECEGGRGFRLQRLPDLGQVERALRCNDFYDVCVNRTELTLSFPNMTELVRWIKGIGSNRLNDNFFLGKSRWQRLNEYYQNLFQSEEGVQATFELIRGKAFKK